MDTLTSKKERTDSLKTNFAFSDRISKNNSTLLKYPPISANCLMFAQICDFLATPRFMMHTRPSEIDMSRPSNAFSTKIFNLGRDVRISERTPHSSPGKGNSILSALPT
jgi:hypothetical protein